MNKSVTWPLRGAGNEPIGRKTPTLGGILSPVSAAIVNEKKKTIGESAESAIVAAAKKGDIRAFELLVIKYQTGLVHFLDRMLHDRAEAEDVAQEAFIRAHRALPTFRGDSSFFTWIRRIGMNLVRDLARSRKNQPTVGVENLDNLSNLEASDAPDLVLQQKQLGEVIDTALKELPEDWRTVLLLREIEGMSYQDIAQLLTLPLGTVRSRIFRARDAVAEKLRPHTNAVSGNHRW